MYKNIITSKVQGRQLFNKTVSILIRNFIDTNLISFTKIRLISLVGIVGFPLYYVFWDILYPQPYESEVLRSIGFGLCVILFTQTQFKLIPPRYFLIFVYLSYLFILPFFFTYMLIKNQGVLIWQLSMIASVIYLFIILDLLNAFVAFIIGASAALLSIVLCEGFEGIQLVFSGEIFIVYAFTFAGAMLLNYSQSKLQKEKLEAVRVVAGNIAHEVRTPLSGIGLENHIIKSHCDDDKTLQSSKAIDHYLKHSNAIIDLVLSDINPKNIDQNDKELVSANELITETLKDFPFTNQDLETVSLNVHRDFEINCIPKIFQHVIFNLIKNALCAIKESGCGKVEIEVLSNSSENKIVVSDDLGLIPSDIQPFIFLPFFSKRKTTKGNGLGLPFCKKVIEGLSGSIKCECKYGQQTNFIIKFRKKK